MQVFISLNADWILEKGYFWAFEAVFTAEAQSTQGFAEEYKNECFVILLFLSSRTRAKQRLTPSPESGKDQPLHFCVNPIFL